MFSAHRNGHDPVGVVQEVADPRDVAESVAVVVFELAADQRLLERKKVAEFLLDLSLEHGDRYVVCS